jgi:hypothetical protein
MTGFRLLTGRPLPLQAPSAFVRVRPRGARSCALPKAGHRRCRASSRRLPRQ